MPEWSEDVAVEIEALQATYGDALTLDEPLQQISMLVLPNAAGQQQQHFVECQLVCTLSASYPSSTPTIKLRDVRGFVNRQEQLQQQLSTDADELAGELLLGHLFESAKAWLSDQDHPEGPCIFCLEDLAGAAAASNAAMRLPCFHAYHESCFAGWWCWQQQAYMDQQRALEEKTGATAAAALVQESLPPKDGQHFRLSCPSCRAPFQQGDLPSPMQQQLQQQLQQQQPAAGQQQQQQRNPDAAKLTAAQLQPFLQLQQQFAKMFVQQQQRQGIIDTDASYCIADWQGPSSSSSTAAAGDADPPAGSAAGSSSRGAAAGGGGGAAAAGVGARDGRRGVSVSAAGPQQRGGGGGRGWGRSRGGRHFRSSDESDTVAGSQQQQQQRSHHPQQQQQQAQPVRHQSWRQQEQEWTPKAGHCRGRGTGRQQQQQSAGGQLSALHATASPPPPRSQQQQHQQQHQQQQQMQEGVHPNPKAPSNRQPPTAGSQGQQGQQQAKAAPQGQQAQQQRSEGSHPVRQEAGSRQAGTPWWQ